MKLNSLLCCASVGLVVSLFWGCAITEGQRFTPLKNGFGYISRSQGLIHVRAWSELQYIDASGRKTTVWPYVLDLESVTITNTTAILIGRKAMRYDEPDSHDILVSRVIVVDGPKVAMDISEDVLKLLCAEDNLNFSDALKNYDVVSLRGTKTGFDVGFIVQKGKEPTGVTCSATWSQLSEITFAVKRDGKQKKEKWSGQKYLEREFH